jgi:hypothetical protein
MQATVAPAMCLPYRSVGKQGNWMQMVPSSDNWWKQITWVTQIECRLLMYVGFVGSYEPEEDDMRYKDDREILRKAGFTEVRYPMSKLRGLLLASTATLYIQRACTALASTAATSRRPDKTSVPAQHAEQGALPSTENVLPRHGLLAWNPTVQLEWYLGGELSLSSKEECDTAYMYLFYQRRQKVKMEPTSSNRPPAGGVAYFPTALRQGHHAAYWWKWPAWVHYEEILLKRADTWNWWIIIAFNLSAGWLPPASSQNKLFRESIDLFRADPVK